MGSESIIEIDGLLIVYKNGRLTIDGINKKGGRRSRSRDCIIDKDGVIHGSVNGNIVIKGNNVKLVIEGDVDGNITGDCNIKVDGDVDGNITGDCDITVEGDVDGNIIGGRVK